MAAELMIAPEAEQDIDEAMAGTRIVGPDWGKNSSAA